MKNYFFEYVVLQVTSMVLSCDLTRTIFFVIYHKLFCYCTVMQDAEMLCD